MDMFTLFSPTLTMIPGYFTMISGYLLFILFNALGALKGRPVYRSAEWSGSEVEQNGNGTETKRTVTEKNGKE